MKKNTNLIKPGFSIAELLIAVTISMVIAVALVPVIGMKKTKVPLNNFNHGIAECYYDEAGRLHFYQETSNKNDRGTDSIVEGACTFNAPRTHHFEVIAIGAGGNGNNSGDNTFSFNAENSPSISGDINLNEHYQENIDNAESECRNGLQGDLINPRNCYNFSQRIRTAINNWSRITPEQVFASFVVHSPKGESGPTTCKAVTNEGATNDECLPRPTAFDPDDHGSCRYLVDWDYVHISGTTSGMGKKTGRIDVLVNDRSQISITSNRDSAGFEVLNASNNQPWFLYLSSSGQGIPGGYNNVTGSPFADNVSANSLYDARIDRHSPNLSGIGLEDDGATSAPPRGIQGDAKNRNCSEISNPASDGRVDANRRLHWEFTPVTLSANSFPHGGYGQVRSGVYENLTGELILRPSAGGGGTSTVTIDGRTLISANSGRTPAERQSQFFQITQPDLPILLSLLDFAKAKNREQEDFLMYLQNKQLSI